MAKVANVFGRLEAFTFSVFLYCIGYIQQAGSNNVKTFASAQIFYSAGSTGLQILIQIFVADTTDLLNRALFSSLPDVPFLVTTWIGAPIAQNLLSHTTWRWGYGLWAIVLPIAFLPLALSLILNGRKAAKLSILPAGPRFQGGNWNSLVALWHDLDVFGLLLLSAAISLILLPLTLAQTAKGGWHNASMIAMVVLGCVFLIVFPLWETNPKLAPKPFLTLQLFKNRTVVAGCVIGFFYFGELFTLGAYLACTANLDSRVLYFRFPIFLLLSTGSPRGLHHSGRSHYAHLLIRLNGIFNRHLTRYQVHEAL